MASARKPSRGGKKARASSSPEALNAEEEAFCQHYALHQNGAEAIRVACPHLKKKSPQYCAEQGSKWLQKSKIQARLTILMKKVAKTAEEEFDITVDRVLQEIASIAFYNSADYFTWGVQYVPRFNKKTGEQMFDQDGNPITEPRPYAIPKPASELSRAQKRAVVGAEMSFTKDGLPVISLKMGDKLNALKLLGTHKKLFNQKIEHEIGGKAGAPVEVKDVSEVKKMDPVAAMKAFEAFRASVGN